MDELLYELQATVYIRNAITQTYNEKKDIDKLIECYSLIDDIQEKIISKIFEKIN